jgi:hypothetical protein
VKLTRKFAELTPDKRPQDGLRFETMEHGGKYPDTMPQAIKLTRPIRESAVFGRIDAAAHLL